MLTLPRKRKATLAIEEQPRPGASSAAPPQPERPQTLGLSQSARRRAVTRRYDSTVVKWAQEREGLHGNWGDWPTRDRIKFALSFWHGAGCELCTAYRDYAAADDHGLEDCQRWKEAPQAQRLLRLLEETSVCATPEDRENAIDERDDAPCKACSFPSKRCRSDSPRLTARDGTVADCENIEVARRAVAALLAFEDGLLADILWVTGWVRDDDPAAMQAWMAEQVETDRSYIPGIFRALDELYGSYGFLVGDYQYRVELDPRGEKEDAAVALPRRCGVAHIESLIKSMKVEVLAKEQRLCIVEGLIQESIWTYQRLREWKDDDAKQQQEVTMALGDEEFHLENGIRTIRDMEPIYLRLSEVQTRLLRYTDVCMVCRAMGRPSDHSIRTCTNRMAQKAHAELVQVERAVNFDPHLGCHRCGLPKLICSRWATPIGETQSHLLQVPGRCCFEGVALETIFGIKYSYKAIWDLWLSRPKTILHYLDNQERICKFLGNRKECSELGVELRKLKWNNLVWEFEWMTQSIEAYLPSDGDSSTDTLC